MYTMFKSHTCAPDVLNGGFTAQDVARPSTSVMSEGRMFNSRGKEHGLVSPARK